MRKEWEMQQVYGVLVPLSDNSYTDSVCVVKKGLLAVYWEARCNLKMEIK